jgi:D-sedoheptulose 7-phosphate isomerase
MTPPVSNFKQNASDYLNRLKNGFTAEVIANIELLAQEIRQAWVDGRTAYICGNGGSAANAMHMANDFHYGIGACGSGPKIPGLRVEALPANAGIITCLANDTGYENIYAHQLQVKGREGDLLIVLSGSGNSENVVRALQVAAKLKIKSHSITAFDGGRCKKISNNAIHFEINDMQIAEDTQLIVGHLCMQWLNTNKPDAISELY